MYVGMSWVLLLLFLVVFVIFDISCEHKNTRPNFKTRIAKDVQHKDDKDKSIKPINKSTAYSK